MSELLGYSKLNVGLDYFDIFYTIRHDKNNNLYMYIDSLIICGKTNRYKGEGTKALNKLIQIAQDAKCSYISLGADTKQPQAKGFVLVDWYKKFGFSIVNTYGWTTYMRKDL